MTGMILRSGRVLGQTPYTPRRRRNRNNGSVIMVQLLPQIPIMDNDIRGDQREQVDEQQPLLVEQIEEVQDVEPLNAQNLHIVEQPPIVEQQNPDLNYGNLIQFIVLTIGLITAIVNIIYFDIN